MHSFKKLALVAATALIGSASAALAAPTAWDMPSGDHGSYTYSGGQTLNNKFGSGTAFSDGFFFIPTELKASSTGSTVINNVVIPTPIDNSHLTSDTLSVILNAKPNTSFTRITSNLLGDYTIDGIGDVNATGTLRVTNLDTSLTLTSPLSFGGTVPASGPDSDDIFQGQTALDLPAGWRNIRVEMDGTVTSNAIDGSALIQGKDAELGVVTTAQIPLPAALAVAPVAAFFGWRARRKLGASR